MVYNDVIASLLAPSRSTLSIDDPCELEIEPELYIQLLEDERQRWLRAYGLDPREYEMNNDVLGSE
jgi:hypothetical protein